MTASLVSRHLGAGDIFPYVRLETADGRSRVLAQFAGRPLLVHLCATNQAIAGNGVAKTPSVLSMSDHTKKALADLQVKLVIVGQTSDQLRDASLGCDSNCKSDVERLKDTAGAIATAFNLGEAGATLLLNKNQRILAVIDPRMTPLDSEGILEMAKSLLPEHNAFFEAETHAPVLRIPGVFEASCCRHLIDVFESSAHEPSGFNEQRRDGAPLVFDEKVKKRRDFVITSDTSLAEQIRVLYLRRIVPEIAKAFHFEVKSHEAFKLARYDASDKGFFRAHRDNTSSVNAHRRFAVSINLNAEEHEGGHLVFPEYCSGGYRPATGEALVFCCSLLHEARPVTKGNRYVQLAFLY